MGLRSLRWLNYFEVDLRSLPADSQLDHAVKSSRSERESCCRFCQRGLQIESSWDRDAAKCRKHLEATRQAMISHLRKLLKPPGPAIWTRGPFADCRSLSKLGAQALCLGDPKHKEALRSFFRQAVGMFSVDARCALLRSLRQVMKIGSQLKA